MSKMQEKLAEKFSSEIREALTELPRQAYDLNAGQYDPSIGHNEMVFGLMVHQTLKFLITKLAEKAPWLKILQAAPRFIFHIRDFKISAYRVGESLDGDISCLLPRNRTGAGMLARSNQLQMAFDFMNDDNEVADDSNCSNLILAHSGTAEAGLSRLFLGVPISVDHRNCVTKWGATLEIFGGDSDSLGGAVVSGPPPLQPPAEKIAPPTLALKPKKQQEAQ
jgi:hypothetical protein